MLKYYPRILHLFVIITTSARQNDLMRLIVNLVYKQTRLANIPNPKEDTRICI